MSDKSTASRAVGVAGTAVTAANGVGTGIAVYGASASSIMSATAGTTGASFATLFGAAGTSGAAATSSGMATMGGVIGGGMATGAVMASAAPVAIAAVGLWGITKLLSGQLPVRSAERLVARHWHAAISREACHQTRVSTLENRGASIQSNFTVRQLAIECGVPASRVLKIFKDAGVVLANEDSLVSNSDKLRLRRHLQSLKTKKEQSLCSTGIHCQLPVAPGTHDDPWPPLEFDLIG